MEENIIPIHGKNGTGKKSNYSIIAGQAQEFINELEKFETVNTILEKYISAQLMPVPNPNAGIKGIAVTGQPEMINVVFLTAFIKFEKK